MYIVNIFLNVLSFKILTKNIKLKKINDILTMLAPQPRFTLSLVILFSLIFQLVKFRTDKV